MLKAGFGSVSITPPPGAPLAGFAARKGVCTGAHDDLFARAMVIDNGEAAGALVGLDLLALPADFVNRARQAVEARVPVAAGGVMIACTHTHAGPVTISTFFNPGESVDPQYMERLAGAIEEAVASAWEHRFEARMGIGSARIEALGVNRRSPDGRLVDEEIGLVKIADSSGSTRGVLVNYACHPTVLGPDNLLATGDFPGVTLARMEERLGPGSFAMYFNGAEGDISVGHSSELSAIGVIAPGRTFERAAELGGRLADAVFPALETIETKSHAELGFLNLKVNLRLKQFPSPEAAAKALSEAQGKVERLAGAGDSSPEYRQAKSELLYASITHYYAGEAARFPEGLMPIELQGVRLPDGVLVGVPGEMFVEIGLRAKQSARGRLLIVGLANGYVGYLPSRRAYQAGGYEVVSARCDSETEDRLAKAIAELEERLIG